jgi:hypothetical protein
MEFCSRCDGGAIYAPNCPLCGGSGFIESSDTKAPIFTVPSPFQKQVGVSRLAREEEKRRRVKIYKAKGSEQKQPLGTTRGSPQQPQITKSAARRIKMMAAAEGQPKAVRPASSPKSPSTPTLVFMPKPKPKTAPKPKPKVEPPRLFRRPVCLSQAASPDSSS